MAFLYTPERWARAQGAEWTDGMERWRRDTLRWLYNRAGVPRIWTDGHRDVLAIGPPASPTAAHVIKILWQEHPTEYLRWLKEQGLKIAFLSNGAPVFDDPVQISDTALSAIARALEIAKLNRWRICPLCGRAFPVLRKTRACPPCRRKYTRRQVQWRLGHAPADPVVFRVLPESEPESVLLSIADGVDAPPSLRRISTNRRSGEG